jgi:acyl-CoA synthetase (AMP-forming)/AMP-acid ligase II
MSIDVTLTPRRAVSRRPGKVAAVAPLSAARHRNDRETESNLMAMSSNIKEAGPADLGPDAPVVPPATVTEFVLGQAHAHRRKRALVDASTGRELDYAGLSGAVRRAGARLASRGVLPGDVLALAAPNSVEFVVAWYGASWAGATVTVVNPGSTAKEIVHQLRQTGARWMITTAGPLGDKLELAAREVGITGTFLTGEFLIGDGGVDDTRKDTVPTVQSPSDVACLAPSTGTTGTPKSVVLTHRNLVAGLSQLRRAERITEDDVVLAALPPSRIFSLQAEMHLPLAQGATVVILPRFDPGSFLAAVEDYGVTRAAVAPAMIQSLLNSNRSDSFDVSSLRLLSSAGAPLAHGLARSAARRLGCRVKQGFGLTEFGGATHVAPDDGPNWPDSIGPALPGVQSRVVDPATKADVATGEPGELLVRSPSMMRGYLSDPEATAAAVDADGWLHTGDIVTVNDDGWFFVTGRITSHLETPLDEVNEIERAVRGTTRMRYAPDRPTTAPAYYLGRPAKLWLSVFRRNWSRTRG